MLGPTVDFADYIINKLRVKNRFYWVFTSSLVLYRIENQRNKIDSFVLTNILGFFICSGFFFCLFVYSISIRMRLYNASWSCLVLFGCSCYAKFVFIRYFHMYKICFRDSIFVFFFSVYKAIGYVTLYVAVCLLWLVSCILLLCRYIYNILIFLSFVCVCLYVISMDS